jgi:hypothetical protein
MLDTIRLEGDFGKPEAAVTLTFYRAAGAVSAAERAGASARLRLKAIAHFDPFIVKRGHVTIRLKIPPLFSPQYIGLTVREIAKAGRAQAGASQPCTTVKTQSPPKFRCTGSPRALLVPIADASRLHKRKSAG